MLAHSLYVEVQISTNVTQTMVVVNRIATTMKAQHKESELAYPFTKFKTYHHNSTCQHSA